MNTDPSLRYGPAKMSKDDQARRERRRLADKERRAARRAVATAHAELAAYIDGLGELRDFRWLDVPIAIRSLALDAGEQVALGMLVLALRREPDPEARLDGITEELGQALVVHLAAALMVDLGMERLVEEGQVREWRLAGVESVLGAHLVAAVDARPLDEVGRIPAIEVVDERAANKGIERVLALANGYFGDAMAALATA